MLSKLKASPARFRVAGRRHGTTITYRLSRAARVTLRFERLTRSHGRLRAHKAGSLAVRGHRGANKLRFGGKLKGERIRAGHYRLTATPAGGRARTVKVTVIRARAAAPHGS